MNALALAVATGLGSGFFPIAPASFASALVCVAVYLAWPVAPVREAALIAGLAVVAIWSAGAAEARLGHDAHPIVIDEFVGQLLALWAVPRSPLWLLTGFLLFRLFDIWKPLGARAVQRLPGGWGILCDDLLAGLYARLVLWAALAWGPVLNWVSPAG